MLQVMQDKLACMTHLCREVLQDTIVADAMLLAELHTQSEVMRLQDVHVHRAGYDMESTNLLILWGCSRDIAATGCTFLQNSDPI